MTTPLVPKMCVQRPRLISILNDCQDHPLTLISAPAGFGKTTLALQWIAQSARASAWLSLDEDLNDSELFLRYVVAAARKVQPQFGKGTERYLTAANLPPPDYLADVLTADLELLGEPLLLFLDDFHAVTSEAVHAIVKRLLTHSPRSLHLVVLTRSDPPWQLGRLRAQRRINELRAAELRFVREEAREFFRRRSGKPLPPKVVDVLVRKTEGWVAGMQMADISLEGAPDIAVRVERLSGSDRLIVDFLAQEVISRLPAETLDFLATTAILDRFCAPLSDHLLADSATPPDSRRMIDSLERDNLFLVPLDHKKQWYRYHQLFRQLLVHQQDGHGFKERAAELHHRAGDWFAGQGLVEEALRHFLACDDMEAAVRLLEENMHAAIDADLSRRTLARWLAIFPQSAENQHPVLLVAHSHLKMANWDISGMAEFLDRAEALLRDPAFPIDPTRRRSLEGDYHALRARQLYWQGDAEAALRHGRKALHMVPSKHRYTHSIVIIYNAAALAIIGQREEGLRLLAKAVSEDCSTGSRNMPALLTAQAAIHCYAGELRAVEQTAEQLLSVQNAVPVPESWQGYAHHFIGSVAYERNLLDSAADHFGRLVQMRYLVSTRLYQDALFGLALVAQARGDRVKAREYVDSAKAFAVEVNDSYSLHMAESLQTRLTLLSEEDPSVPPERGPILDSNKFWLEVPSLTRAEYLVRKATPSDCSAALRCVEDGLHKAEQHHNTWQAIQFEAVKILALRCSGHREAALELLEETLRRAEPLGFVRSFVDRGPGMAEMLKEILEKRMDDGYLRLLLNAFEADQTPAYLTAIFQNEGRGGAGGPAVPAPAASGGLSDRELDVLLLIAERLSNKEIAEKLFVASETVKKHTANLYRKLNAHGRREAVAAAMKLGLIPRK